MMSTQDGLLIARIAAIARRHTRGRSPSGADRARAVSELAEAAAGRADLLAQHAGVTLGFHETGIEAPQYEDAARLCIEAGADQSLIPRWIEEGRRRAAAAAQVPFTGWPSSRHPER